MKNPINKFTRIKYIVFITFFVLVVGTVIVMLFILKNGNKAEQTDHVVIDEKDFIIKNDTLISYNGNGSEITIPLSVTTISDKAFYENTTVSSITILSNVAHFGSENDTMFLLPSVLKEIIVDENNSCYKSIDGILFNSDYTKLLIYPPCKNYIEYIIPETVEIIAPFAFANSRKIKSIIIPNSVTNIGSCAFEVAIYLENINLPPYITVIMDSTFRDCYSLNNVKIPNEVTLIRDGAFYNCTGLKNINIPSKINDIGMSAFAGCISLNNLIIPDNAIVRESAFYGCTSLINVTVPDNAIIEDKAFYGTPWSSINNDEFEIHYDQARNEYVLTEYNGIGGNVIIPEGVTEFENPFANGTANTITNLTIPNSMTNKNNIIITCDELENLENIYVHDDNKNYTSVDGLLYTSDKKALVKFPKGRGGNIEIPDIVENIGEYAFSSCTKIENIIIPQNVISIGVQAFIDCTSLETVVLPNTISELMDTFQGCSKLTTVYYTGTEEQWDSIDILEVVKMLSDLSISKINVIFNYKP